LLKQTLPVTAAVFTSSFQAMRDFLGRCDGNGQNSSSLRRDTS
jgi:hypothetical protein